MTAEIRPTTLIPGPPGQNAGVLLLAKSGVQVPAPANNTNENTLATVTIPGGVIGPNGSLRIYAAFSYTGSTNIKVMRVRLGGQLLWGSGNINTATQTNIRNQLLMTNRNSQSSQIIGGPNNPMGGNGTGAIITTNIDTSVSQALTFTATKNLGTEAAALEDYLVELIPG